MMDKARAMLKMVAARRDGATLKAAAGLAGVHVATACRWQAKDADFRRALAKAAREARMGGAELGPRPLVRWRRDCPLCRAKVVVRKAGTLPFWRCGLWPRCPWSSWRPRAPRDCRKCGAACFWSHSRKSIACGACGVRIMTH